MEVFRVAATEVPVCADNSDDPNDEASRASKMQSSSSKSRNPKLVSLEQIRGAKADGGREEQGTPSKKRVDEMNVMELGKFLSSRTDALEEGAVPFLPRFVLGEFHYGQRATRFLPGQKATVSPLMGPAVATAPASLPPLDTTKGELDNEGAPAAKRARVQQNGAAASSDTNLKSLQESVSAAFNVLAKESKFRHLHQAAGWVDMNDRQVWDDYVKDVMAGKLRAGDRLFEAGCGVLAFLRACEGLAENLVIGGMDGAGQTVKTVQETLVALEFRQNFFVGLLPDALKRVPDDSWDAVVCNSVFQYLGDEEQAKRSVHEMVRVAKRWVIIADICDRKFHRQTNERVRGLGWTKSSQAPEYRNHPKSWWEDEFEGFGHLVSIRHMETASYVRRTERYVVYIEKGAGEDTRSGPKGMWYATEEQHQETKAA